MKFIMNENLQWLFYRTICRFSYKTHHLDENFICLIALFTIKLTPGCNFALYFIHFNEYLLLSVTIGYYRLLSVAIGCYRQNSKSHYEVAKMHAHGSQWISHKMYNRHPLQLKKSWEPFGSYQLNCNADLADLAQLWCKWAGLAVLFI